MSGLRILRSLLLSGCTCAALLAGAATVQAQSYEPAYDPSQPQDDNGAQAPGRVARLAYLSGQVQFAPAGDDAWGSVDINRPMVIGDRLLTGDDGRAVLELGDASVRIDHGSAFDFLNLDQGNVQIELSQGTLNLAVREMADGENFEVDTPTIAFVASTPGVYRIDNDPSGTGSMVTVFSGSGIVYGENGASRQVVEGTSYRFDDSTLARVDVDGLPQADDFDRFCETRDTNYQRYTREQREYVPPTMIGGEDLYQYGRWNTVPEYGNVWYPRSVPVGWAPYRYGHWAWIDPWGWTWVDNQPWGFAPFHYGRWVYVRNRWGWCPGPVDVRPVYAPALVAFVGGSGLSLSIRAGGGGPVGWFPLGPRDVYVPWFHASRGYFTSVNVTNIRNVYVNRVVINNFYNDYRHHRYDNIHQHNRYRYRNLPGAVTMVPRKVFTDARPVHPAVLKLDRSQLQHIQVAVRPDVNPGKASLGVRAPAVRPAVLRDREPFARPVVARHAPSPRPVEFAARQKLIASQHGQPLTTGQMRNLRKTHGTETRNDRVKLVGSVGTPTRAKSIDAARHAGAPTARPAQVSVRASSAHPGVAPRVVQAPVRPGNIPTAIRSSDTVHPIPARPQPNREPQPLRAGELRSARFRHPDRPATLPRAPALRAADQPQHASPRVTERLPVARPLARTPQTFASQATQPQPSTDIAAAQRMREARPQPRASMQETMQPRTRMQQAPRRTPVQPAQEQRVIAQPQRAREPQARRPPPVQMPTYQPVRQPAPQLRRAAAPMPRQPVQQAGQAPSRAIQRPPERQAPPPRSEPGSARSESSRARKHADSVGDKVRKL